MVTEIQKWGNGQGVHIPKALLEQLSLTIGDDVEIVIENGRIILEPARKTGQKYTIEKLVAGL